MIKIAILASSSILVLLIASLFSKIIYILVILSVFTMVLTGKYLIGSFSPYKIARVFNK